MKNIIKQKEFRQYYNDVIPFQRKQKNVLRNKIYGGLQKTQNNKEGSLNYENIKPGPYGL